jgi:uncharacterized protein YfaS (alpha-2-macroglobulin family)
MLNFMLMDILYLVLSLKHQPKPLTCMLSRFIKTCTSVLILLLFICIKTASAQNKYDAIVFRIDSLSAVGLPKSALKEVDKLDKLARDEKNASQQLRAVIYRITFQSYIEEEALATIINTLKIDIDKAEYPAKPVLQSMLAEMYWNYYKDNRYVFTQRSRQLKPDADFTKWDLQTIINETGRFYHLSLADAKQEQATSIEVLAGVLKGDKSTRYLRPTLYDLLIQRAFEFYLSEESTLLKPKMPFSLNDPAFFGDSFTFARFPVVTSDTASTWYQGIKLLQQATAFHLQTPDEEALADVDMQRLEFLHDKSNAPGKDSLYLAGLKGIATRFAAKPIGSRALYAMGGYYKDIDSLKIAREYFESAKKAFPESVGGKNAVSGILEIDQKALSVTVEDVNIPNKPLLALFSYKNVNQARFLVYRLSSPQLSKLKKDNSDADDDNVSVTQKLYKFLTGLKPVEKQLVDLPDPGDYRAHTAEFKIDALPIGNYMIVVEDPVSKKTDLIGIAQFQVSELTCVTRKRPNGVNEILVLNRDTGEPMAGVIVNVYNWKYIKDKRTQNKFADGVSDAHGVFTFANGNGNYIIRLSKQGDTFVEGDRYFTGFTNQKSDNDEPKPVIRTVLFTDRQIYRPGQTIYFKGLQISTLKGKSSIVPGENLTVTFFNANREQTGSLKLITNDFGTVTGSFVIPQNMLNGIMSISTDYGYASVRVEEYKRPTFGINFLPVMNTYRINDSVRVKGKVTSFSGYGLSDASVAYRISRSADYKDHDQFVRNYVETGDTEILNDTIKTNTSGEFEIKFKALPGNGQPADGYSYKIFADVTDGSDETQSVKEIIKVSNHVLVIDANVPDKLFSKDNGLITLKLNNTNDQPQKGKLNVKIFALKQPSGIFKKRAWGGADQFILAKDEFKNIFPYYAYNNEEDEDKWPTLRVVADTLINVTDSTKGKLDLGLLKKQVSGLYKVVINADNLKGDTVSGKYYINVYNHPAKVTYADNWVNGINTTITKAGESAEFWLGLGKRSRVLVEKYEGSKMLSAEWLTVEGDEQQSIKVLVSSTAKNNFAVQFLTINNNQQYSFYQQLPIKDTVASQLNIRLLTFRDKLQPGEKEQWKVQVSGNEKEQAELLAGMYDASLDDISPARNWGIGQPDYNTYKPLYYKWQDNDQVIESVSEAFDSGIDDWMPGAEVSYETLSWFDYAYWGWDNYGYNRYLEKVKEHKKAAVKDQRIEALYLKNAALVKSGYVVSGRVISSWGAGQEDVKIRIKGLGITTFSNSLGYYKIKLPYKSTLIFSKATFNTRQVNSPVNGVISISSNVNMVRFPPPLALADAGVKSQEGDPNADVSIDEPVGNSNAKQVFEDNTILSAPGKASGYIAYDAAPDIRHDKVVMREIRTTPNSKYDKQPKPIVARKNFNETAFFYPQLRTDEKGEVLIEFTIPEALTKWKFRAFAHNKQLRFGYTEAEVVTQKQLSINANMPRFLREGDTITVSARLANLETERLKGTIELQLFNAINMQPASLLINKADAQQKFEIDGSSTKSVSFKLVIPAGLDALTYRLSADAGKFTDGEENTIPVLPNRMLVTESMPMMVRTGQAKIFNFEKLINQNSTTLQNKTLTLEYTQNPAWHAVQAIPYMMEFPYECSEQLFSRYYANSLSTDLIAKMPVIKQVFDRWKDGDSKELLSNLEKNQELKTTLLEETPWLQSAMGEAEQKKRIAQLFDLNKMGYEMKANLDKLKQKQLPSGAFPWFGGNYADEYITRHVLEGIGQLVHLNIASAKDSKDLGIVGKKALDYMDEQLLKDDKEAKKQKKYESRDIGADEVHAWYVRSYFTGRSLDAEMKAVFNNYLKRADDQWVMQNIYQQGMIALTMVRNGKLPVAKAIIKSLMETAQQSDEMGMYWGKNLLGYYWYQSPIETQSLMIELFTEVGGNAKAVEEMKIWLMRNKQTNNWQTTKATAAAVYALLLKQDSWLQSTQSSEIKINDKPLADLKPEIKADAGSGYIKTNWVAEQVKPVYGKIEVKNNGQSISYGAMHWQYLEQMDKISPSKTDLSLERKYFIKKQTDAGPVLQEIGAAHQPKTGDLLKVVVYLKAGRDFEYIQLKDLRPAGTEPVSALSDYKYQDGLWYYQVTKDVATNFFISQLNKGSYVFEYELRVAQPGNFSTGITSIQCMYAPEFNAHSEGSRVTFKP